MEPTSIKKLYRSRSDQIIAGVAGGIAKYFEIDPLLVRIVFLVSVLLHGAGILVYLILLFVVPLEPTTDPSGQKEEKIMEFFSAAKDHVTETVHDMKTGSNWFSGRHNLFGLALLTIGVIALFNQIFPYRWFSWDYFWPTIVIVLGFVILLKK